MKNVVASVCFIHGDDARRSEQSHSYHDCDTIIDSSFLLFGLLLAVYHY